MLYLYCVHACVICVVCQLCVRVFLQHGHFKWHHDHDELFEELDENPKKLKKCAYKIAPWASITIAVGLAVFVYGTYFAALRRQMLRERFGIEGRFSRDWLLWAFCGPCALTQETRTLMYNHVEEGLWHGPLSAPAPVAPMAV
jgi:Cys-rich protein (TIGR01571 family)